MASNVKGGQVRALGTSALRRSTVLPEVPTIAEAGVPGYESTIWIGIMAPAGTPQAVADKLNAAINQVIDRADVKEVLGEAGRGAAQAEPRRVRQVSARRHRKMGARDQSVGDADAVAAWPRITAPFGDAKVQP